MEVVVEFLVPFKPIFGDMKRNSMRSLPESDALKLASRCGPSGATGVELPLHPSTSNANISGNKKRGA